MGGTDTTIGEIGERERERERRTRACPMSIMGGEREREQERERERERERYMLSDGITTVRGAEPNVVAMLLDMARRRGTETDVSGLYLGLIHSGRRVGMAVP